MQTKSWLVDSFFVWDEIVFKQLHENSTTLLCIYEGDWSVFTGNEEPVGQQECVGRTRVMSPVMVKSLLS